MAYTAPATWVGGQLVGATDLNAQIRDNMLFIAGTTGVFPSPHMTTATVDSGGLTITTGGLGVGGSVTPSIGIQVIPTTLTTTAQVGVSSGAVFTNAASSIGAAFAASFTTAAAAFSMASGYGYLANAPALGASSTVTNMYGFYAVNQGGAGITNAYGVYVATQSGASTTNFGVYVAGSGVVITGAAPIQGISNTVAYGGVVGQGTGSAGTCPPVKGGGAYGPTSVGGSGWIGASTGGVQIYIPYWV